MISSTATCASILTDPPISLTQKGGHWRTAKLTGFFLIKSLRFSKYSIIPIFSTGVDALPLEQKTGSSDWQSEPGWSPE